jgi:hypothetical protein
MARVLVLTGDAAEELDAMYAVFRLREGGHDICLSLQQQGTTAHPGCAPPALS